jgi:F0F1-type ATP synthase assembly protein I
MSAMSQWVAGALMGVLSLLGLFLYSRAADGMFGLFGGLLFLFGLAVIIVLVHKATDYSTEAHDETHDEAADENRSDQAAARSDARCHQKRRAS